MIVVYIVTKVIFVNSCVKKMLKIFSNNFRNNIFSTKKTVDQNNIWIFTNSFIDQQCKRNGASNQSSG